MSDDQPTQSTSSFQQQPPKSDKSTKARDKGANKGAKKAAKGKGKEVKDEPEELNKLAEAFVSNRSARQNVEGAPNISFSGIWVEGVEGNAGNE